MKQPISDSIPIESILEGMGEAVSIHGLDGRFLLVNSEFESGVGLKREHVIGKRPSELGIATPKETRFIRQQVIPRLMKGESVRDVESVVRLKNGSFLPVSINFSLMRNVKGEPIAIINVAKDVSRLKKAEDAIREFSRRMLTIREDEKRKIATNLHDEIGGLAVNLSTRLSLLEEEINDW